jgi:hypothetical protein
MIMTRTINISLNVPENYGMEELTRQLTAYGEFLVMRRRLKGRAQGRFSQHFLAGLSMPQDKSDKELVDDYLVEKYGV